MTTLRDIAREVGLSVSTVSRALGGHPHIDERTRRRVQQAARRLNYQPNALARALRRKQTRTIGLIIPDILNRFYAAGTTVIQHTLEQHGYRLIVCISNDDAESEASYLQALAQEKVEGIIHVPCAPDGARTSGITIPLVELNRCSDGGSFDAVIADDRDGALQLTRYLLELGHRRIGVIAGRETLSTTRARVAGIAEAFRAAGHSLPDDLICYGDYSQRWGETSMQRLLALSRRPTAVFATGNQLVLGVLGALSKARLRVPEDISLAGYDDPEWFAVWRPGITTYALPLREMGLVATQILLSQIRQDNDARMPTITRISGRLVIRESCAPLPGK